MSKLKKCTLLSTENNKLQRWYDEENQELISQKACIAYPIRDGIPIMLVNEARVIKDN